MEPTPVFLPGESYEQTSLKGHRVAKNQARLKQLSIYVASQVAVVVKHLPANAGDVGDLGSILFIFFFILFSIMVFHRILNIVPCAVK